MEFLMDMDMDEMKIECARCISKHDVGFGRNSACTLHMRGLCLAAVAKF